MSGNLVEVVIQLLLKQKDEMILQMQDQLRTKTEENLKLLDVLHNLSVRYDVQPTNTVRV
jgi:hypothetical protein